MILKSQKTRQESRMIYPLFLATSGVSAKNPTSSLISVLTKHPWDAAGNYLHPIKFFIAKRIRIGLHTTIRSCSHYHKCHTGHLCLPSHPFQPKLNDFYSGRMVSSFQIDLSLLLAAKSKSINLKRKE